MLMTMPFEYSDTDGYCSNFLLIWQMILLLNLFFCIHINTLNSQTESVRTRHINTFLICIVVAMSSLNKTKSETEDIPWGVKLNHY